MKHLDSHHILTDATGDGGDSANFHSCWVWLLSRLSRERRQQESKLALFWNQGRPVRHPSQAPWNNPQNFSRDQAVLLMSVLPPDNVRKFFWQTILRFNFLPNSERDWPASQKYPFPHRFHPDSELRKSKVIRLFDWADPATPDFLGALIIWGKMWWLAWFLPFGWLWCFVSILFFRGDDFKQLFVTAEAYGLHTLMAKLHPVRELSKSYFETRRQLPEMHELWMQYFDLLKIS